LEDVISEVNLETKIRLFKEILLILFKTESLEKAYTFVSGYINQYNKKSNTKKKNLTNISTEELDTKQNKENKDNEDNKLSESIIIDTNQSKININDPNDTSLKHLSSLLDLLKNKETKMLEDCLRESLLTFKDKKDLNGYLFNLISQQVLNYYEDIPVDKENLTNTLKKIIDKGNEAIKEKPIDKMLNDMKNKVVFLVELFDRLLKKEIQLELNVYNNSRKEYDQTKLIKLILQKALDLVNTNITKLSEEDNMEIYMKKRNEKKKSIKNLNETETKNIDKKSTIKSKKSQKDDEEPEDNKEDKEHQLNENNLLSLEQNKIKLEKALKLVELNVLDLSLYDIFNCNDETINSIKYLFENILWINNKLKVKQIFKKFMLKTLGADTRIDYIKIKRKKADGYFDSFLKQIIKGNKKH